jgi:hypothetical protein
MGIDVSAFGNDGGFFSGDPAQHLFKSVRAAAAEPIEPLFNGAGIKAGQSQIPTFSYLPTCKCDPVCFDVGSFHNA